MIEITRNANVQVWVCANERTGETSKPSCGFERGTHFFRLLREKFAPIAAGSGKSIFVNRSLCQGFCHKNGVTVTVEPFGLKWQAVVEEDLEKIVKIVQEKL